MTPKPRVLFIDDEAHLLASVALNLRKHYEVLTAESGEQGLALLAKERDIQVVVCDMRMPRLSGADTLARVRVRNPSVTRILLTGQTDIASAIAAINEGEIFRFLTKPCDPERLIAMIGAGVEHHRMVTAERDLLENTVRQTVTTLVDILAIANPHVFGRATRVKQHALATAEILALPDRWQLEIAATLHDLGQISLPHDIVEKIHAGHQLSVDEQQMVKRAPAITNQLVAKIPRLDAVREILAFAHRSGRAASATPRELAGAVLRAASELDTLVTSGVSSTDALARLRGHDEIPARILDALATVVAPAEPRFTVIEVPLERLHAGMVFAEDVHLASGALLVTRGYEITPSFLARIGNFASNAVRGPLRVRS